MARKPTKAELRKALLVSEWGEEDLADSRVLAIRERLKKQEEERNAPPNFDNVRSGSSTKTYDAGRTSLDKMGAAFTGGLADVGADLMFRDIDAAAAEKLRVAAENKRIAQHNESFLGNLTPDYLERDFVSPTTSKLAAAMGETDIYKRGFEGLSKFAKDNRAEVDQEVKANIERNPARGRIERTLLDVAGSPQSLASIPGGAFAAIPALTTYNDAYRRMREGGTSPEASNRYAEQQAAVEGGISAIPAGNVLKIAAAPFRRGLANVVTKPFRNNAAEIAIRTGRTAVGESMEEGIQTVAADLVNQATAAFGDDAKGREVAKQAISKDLLADTLRAGAAGLAGGGGFGGIHSSLEVARENAKLVVAANKRLDQDEAARTGLIEASARNRAGPLDRSNDIDVDKANSLLIGEDWRREAATKRLDTVNSRIQETQAELAQINDAEFKAKMAEEAGEPATPFDITRKKRVGQTLVNLELAKTQLNDMLGKDTQGRAMLDAKAQQDAAAQAEAARVAEAETRAQPQDLTGLGPAMGVKPVNKRQAARNEAEAKRKAEEASLREYANGGNTASQTAPAGPSAARTLVQNLSKNRGSADSKRALSLLASGRLEIVNNLGDLGIQAKPGTVTKGMEQDGKMYIFADAFDNSADLAPQLAATLFHETKHAADFGEGDVNLPSNLAGFIGMENTASINRKIEEAANRGNKIAQQAVANAELARSSERNPARKDTAYEEELLPHLISETKTARNKASGLGNIIADVRNAVKGQYSTMFGTDEGVSVDDVFKLSEKLTDYVAQNPSFNTQPKTANSAPVQREMIVSGGTTQDIALKEGRTYLSADGKRKYEIDDSKSRLLIPGDFDTGKTYNASEILSHDELYKELPELKDVKIKFDDAGDEFGAYYSPTGNMVVVNTRFIGPKANNFNSNTHQYIVHEMQHAAQKKAGSTNGASPDDFLTPEDRKVQQKIQNIRGAISFANEIKMPKDQIFDLQDQLIELETDFEGRRDAAVKKYKKVLGEQEAYNTAERLSLTKEERAEDTYDIGTNLEQKFLSKDGVLLSERGKKLADIKDYRSSQEESTARFSESGAEIAQVSQTKLAKKSRQLAGLFLQSGMLGKELSVKAEQAVGEASYFADLAQITSLRIKRGTKQAAERLVAEGKAGSLTQGIELMNKRIEGTLGSLVHIEEEARRQSAIAGLVREYPELAGIQDGYNLINDGTRQIVRQMLASKTGPMTDSEIAKMKTLIKNQTRYLTRAYAAFQGNDGKTWSQKLENEYSIAKAMVAKGAAIPAKYQDSYRTYKAALDYIARENVAVFDEVALSEMTLDKVRMVYDTWFSNRKGVEDEIKRTNDPDEAGVVKEQLIDAIVARGKEVNDRQISNRAHKIINGLLGLNETSNPVVSYYRGFKQDKSILMDRTELPQELKDLFGEITDPALRIMLTISKQGELAARTGLLLEVKNDMYGRKIISNEDKADDNNDTFSQQLKGDSWGPMADHWVTPELWETIRDDREISTNMSDAIGRLVLDANAVNTKLGAKALSYYTRLAGLQKVAAIVWNPAQTIWNFGGSWITGIKEGNVNPQNYVRAGKAAAKLFAKELQAAGAGGRILQNDPDVEDLIRYDVIDSAMVQEIRKLPNQYIRQMINDHGRVRSVLSKSADISFAAVKQIFALSDLTVKIANYYHQVNMLEAYYEAEGVQVTPDTLKKEAADVIKDTNITFRRAAPIVKMGERAGLTYVMPYIQGVFRSAIYGYVHGIKDVVRSVNDAKTAKGKAIMLKHAMGRIAGSTTAVVLVQALAKSVLTGDEDKDAKIRMLQTLDARYGDSVYVGDDAKGNPLMLRFSRFDPLGPLTDIVRIAHSDSTTEQKNRDIAEHVHGLLIKPRLGQEILKSALEFVTNDKTPAVKPKGTKLERLFPRMTTATKDFLADAPGTDYNDGEALMGLLDTMLPGFTNIIDPNNTAVTGQSPQYKKPDASDSLVADMLRATGGRMDKIDVNMAAFVAGKDLSTVRMEARTRVFDKLQTVDANDRTAVMAITELLDDERKAFIRVKEVYEGMEALGMSKRQIDTVLKDEGKLTEHDRHLLYSGKYDTSLEGWRTNGTSVLSKKSIEQRDLQSDKRSPDEQTAAEKREAVKKAVKVLRELGIKVKE